MRNFQLKMGWLVCLSVACVTVASGTAYADVGGTDTQAKVTADGGTPSDSPTGGVQYGAPLEEETRRSKAERRRARARKLRRERARRLAERKRAEQSQPTTPDPAPAAGESGLRFPVDGEHSFGDDGARFGAKREGHIHQGQDIIAAEGTPLVSPADGTVYWRAYQAGAAGYYVVIADEARNRSYVFMHLRKGSWLVKRGDTVKAGQQIGEVGQTGRAVGPHLHFEIWENGWYTKTGAPIDPLSYLMAWDAKS